MEDLYELLEVPRDATQADIKKSYRQLVRKYHPDAHPGDKDAEERFKKINAAYSVLSDPEKRARYDQFGSADGGGDPFGGMGGMDFGDLFGDLFSQVFGGGMGRRQTNPNAPQPGGDLEMALRVSLLEAAQGVARNIEVPRWESCQTCGGSGAKAGTKPETCKTCGGHGQVRQAQQSLFGQFVTVTTCPTCHGSGKTIKEKCPDCGGRGQVRRTQKLEVKVPAGVERGTRLRIPGAGEGGVNGGPAGDLYLVMDVKPDDRFERDGADLHTRLILTYPQAALGTEAEIETLTGEKEKITVPAGTPFGKVLKLRGKGMPRLGRERSRGDLYAHVFVDVPTSLTEKQKKLITELAEEMKAPVGVNEPGFFDKVKKLFN
ncbi:MAG: molecular chaperone DnaJ [Synergistaceae bacterium]|nr:molecular chaperone DnaJ [Synergistaceae bacterium]